MMKNDNLSRRGFFLNATAASAAAATVAFAAPGRASAQTAPLLIKWDFEVDVVVRMFDPRLTEEYCGLGARPRNRIFRKRKQHVVPSSRSRVQYIVPQDEFLHYSDRLLGGMPWSDQDASGEIAAMSVGASLWGLYNQTGEFGIRLTKPGTVGNQYGYASVKWMPGSPVFNLSRSSTSRMRPVLKSRNALGLPEELTSTRGSPSTERRNAKGSLPA